jgi:phage major head subunit gpT-like protein
MTDRPAQPPRCRTATLALTRGKPATFDEAARTVELVWTTGGVVGRYGMFPDNSGRGHWLEELSLDAGHVDLARLRGGAPFLNSHNAWDLGDVIGVVETAAIQGGVGTATVRLSARPEVEGVFRDLADGILRNVSVGYDVQSYERLAGASNQVPTFRATAWTPVELSLVPIPADAGAQVRAAGELGATQAETSAAVEESDMAEQAPTTAADPAVVDPAPAIQAERARVSAIMDLTRRGRHGEQFAELHISQGSTVEAVRAASLDLLYQRTEAEPIRTQHRVEGGYDATDPVARRDAMGTAIVLRHAPGLLKAEAGSRAMEFRGWSMADLAAEHCGIRSRNRREILTRALHTTSDFPLVLENALNKTLLAAYEQAPQTYRRWAAQRTFADFRPHNMYRIGDFPDLTVNPEAVEVTLGTMGETKESVSALKYARRINLSFEMLVNDDMGAFTDIAMAAGRRAADKENALVYAQLALNSGSGPTLRDGAAMCTTTRTNKAASGTVIDVTNLAAGRAALRKLTSIDGLKMNIIPRIVLCGPDKETQALQVLQTTILPVTDGTSNPWKGNYDVVTDANISGNNWYQLAEPAAVPVMVWGYLADYEGLTVETMPGWSTVGVEYRVMLVFGTGGIDWRGIFHNPGA